MFCYIPLYTDTDDDIKLIPTPAPVPTTAGCGNAEETAVPFFCISAQKEVCAKHPHMLPFAFSEQVFQAAFLQFGDTAKKIWGVQRGSPPLCRGVSNRGASRPVGTRFCFAKSSVLYLCFRLTRKRGWRHTLRCSRVWQQTLFRGSRTGGFCDVRYSTNAGFLRSKIRLDGKGSRGI